MAQSFFNASILHNGDSFIGGIRIENGIITEISAHIKDGFDCKGLSLLAGIIDTRVYVGEPGLEYRETFASASKACAAGGVTTIFTQPTTNPTLDNPALIDYVRNKAKLTAKMRVHPMAAITKGCNGEELAEIGLLKAAGAIAFTDGAKSIQNTLVMKRALTYARDFDALIVHHCEDEALKADGVMNEGEFSARLGLSGISHEVETIMLARDIALLRLTGGKLHVSAVSCGASVALIKQAKQEGLRITASVSINNLSLNENDVAGYKTFAKVSPPLRSEEERQALIEGVRDGVIDIITSDHRPQDVEAKRLPFAEAAFGAVGLETLLPAALRLYHDGALTLAQLSKALSENPARVFGLKSGVIAKGYPADFILADLNEPFVFSKDSLNSKCKNTPFDEARFMGKIKATFVNGAQING